MKKLSYKGFKIGDTITVTEPIECYYYNYPAGKNLVKFLPGETAQIVGFPAKVTKQKGDNTGDYFILFDAKGERFGVRSNQAVKVGKHQTSN